MLEHENKEGKKSRKNVKGRLKYKASEVTFKAEGIARAKRMVIMDRAK